MPANLLMSWEPRARRWWKMERGKRFVVSVRQLRNIFGDPQIPETKEGSYQWANRWWEERRQSPPEPTQRLEHHDMETGEPTGIFEEVPQSYIDQQLAHRDELRRRVEALIRSGHAPAEREVGSLVARYLDTVLSRHKAGEISVGAYANARSGLHHFRDFAGRGAAVESINAERLQEYYDRLISSSGPRSVVTRRKHFRFARNFLQWLDDLGLHPAPRNLNRRQYRFKGGEQAVPTIQTDEVKRLLAAARGQLKLHILLMLNCGMTQQDISDLRPSEVDWSQRRNHEEAIQDGRACPGSVRGLSPLAASLRPAARVPVPGSKPCSLDRDREDLGA